MWDFGCVGDKENPDIVIASAGDTVTLEALAATRILRKYIPNINIRYVNVVDLYKLVSHDRHPHGLTDKEYNDLFTVDKPIIFNFHGYPHLIHQLTYNRENENLHVRGYNEEGTITTAFDMRVQNKVDRYNLVLLAIKHLNIDEKLKQQITTDLNEILTRHKTHIAEHGVEIPEVQDWVWEE